jgi:hypothetical protein
MPTVTPESVMRSRFKPTVFSDSISLSNIEHGSTFRPKACSSVPARDCLEWAQPEFEGFTAVPIQITTTDRIEVSGLVGSRIYSFLVDTGSRRSVVDWKIKETNQIPVRFSGTLYLD